MRRNRVFSAKLGFWIEDKCEKSNFDRDTITISTTAALIVKLYSSMTKTGGYFMRRLRHYCTSELIEIIAYCLMPNHYHLLVYLKDNNLSTKVMQPLAVSYTKSVNRQQGRVGPIFQGAF